MTSKPIIEAGWLKSERESKEYLVVSDTNSKVLLRSPNLNECRRLLTQIRKAGGQASMFKRMRF